MASDCESGPREILAPGTDIAFHLTAGDPCERAEYGMLTAVGDERALASALSDMLDDKGLRMRYAEAGLKRVRDFALPKIMARYADVLHPIVTVSANSAWNVFNFRMGLLAALRDAGFSVHLIVPEDPYAHRLKEAGFKLHIVPIQSKGMNPCADVRTFWAYRRLYRRLRPAVACHFTIKPDIYGGLAAASCGIPSVNNITGLGYAFISRSLLTRIVQGLYRISQRRAEAVFFQNPDDRELFLHLHLVKSGQAFLIPGSGVDTDRFSPRKRSGEQSSFVFLLIGRMLYDKGIAEFVEASRLLKAKGLVFRALLLGDAEAQNPAAIPREVLDGWVSEGVVEYLGKTDRVEEFIEQADCIVLPSYREGTPRTLLEAASMGRPVIATDVPGCREAVEDGVNGY
ncbi:MAG TPA: glycosyltransferase, partial [Spirochaetia bacterium]|nr:glycosyltransferase [Spirochaetia bacterium]